MKMRKYMVYVDGEQGICSFAIPAKNVIEVMECVQGKVLKIVDMTDDFLISIGDVCKALFQYGFCQNEVELIAATLLITGICQVVE